jgi:hypothetical protein
MNDMKNAGASGSSSEGQEGETTRKDRRWYDPRPVPQNRYLLAVALFTLAGVVGGYVYYALVGCRSGGCVITSSPVMSMIWGGLLGYLLNGYFFRSGS